MNLQKLSGDILTSIWAQLEFSDLMMLHECGDRSLSALMHRHPPNSVLLVSNVRFMYRRTSSLLPNFASSIVHFELRTASRLAEHPHVTQAAIRALSPKLHTLILHNPEAELFLVSTDPNELKELSLMYSASLRELGIDDAPKMIDLSKLFPGLRNLTVSGSEEAMSLRSGDLCVLKSLHLTALHFYHSYLIDHHVLNFLPSTLEELSLGTQMRLASSNLSLPPNLTTFNWNRIGNPGSVTSADLVKLPQSLLHFKYVSHHDAAIPLQLMGDLPSRLRTFTTGDDLVPEGPTALPLELRELKMKLLPQLATLAHQVIPPCLTTLRLFMMQDDRTVDLSCLPTTLTKLTLIAKRGTPTGAHSTRLPPNLTSLEHHTGQSLEGEWPDSLLHLKVTGPSSNTIGCTLKLPSALLSLSVHNLYNRDASSLPSTLTDLRVESLMEMLTVPLPRSLTALRCFHGIVTTEFVNNLPGTLSSLYVSYLDDLGIQLELSACSWPRNLTDLSLLSYTATLTEQDILNLPLALNTFDTTCEVPTDLVVHFPRGLRTLGLGKVGGNFVGALDRCVLDLPRRLTTLKVVDGVLAPESAGGLPRSLTDISLSRTVLEPHLYFLLPVGLNSFHFDTQKFQPISLASYKGPFDPVTREKLAGNPSQGFSSRAPTASTSEREPSEGCSIS